MHVWLKPNQRHLLTVIYFQTPTSKGEDRTFILYIKKKNPCGKISDKIKAT